MSQIEIFFELLRAGLWDADIEPFATKPKWEEIYEWAKKQSVIAIILDGMLKLPNGYVPSAVLLSWLKLSVRIERTNTQHNADLCKLVDLFDWKGINTRLMKGQGCAIYYPHPEHRQSGDIDLFVGEEQYEKAKQLIEEAGIVINSEGICDAHFSCGKTLVEMHRKEILFYNKQLNRRIQQICREEEWTTPQYINIEKQKIALFNPTFNVFYIFIHFYHHFMQVGIGLRQICDWMLVMKSLENDIDRVKLKEYVVSMKVLRAWQAFYGLTVEYMGLKLSDAPSWMRSYSMGDVSFLLKDIMDSGNFGKYNEYSKKRNFHSGLLTNVSPFVALTKRLVRVSKFGYREALAYPLWKMTQDKQMWNRYKTR
jgi:hypothetical protein